MTRFSHLCPSPREQGIGSASRLRVGLPIICHVKSATMISPDYGLNRACRVVIQLLECAV